MMTFTPEFVRLHGSEPADAVQLGQKAATLAALARAGYPVPPGVSVPAAAYLDHIRALGLTRGSAHSFGAWAAEVHEAMLGSTVDPDLVTALHGHVTAISHGAAQWIVRSSAVGEDSVTDSFAGQFESVVIQPMELAQAIRTVWASAWAPAAVAYRGRRGLVGMEDVPVGVLIQPMIEADYAGVLFTTSPTSDATGAVVESVAGAGRGLVDGSVAPRRIYFDAEGNIERAEGPEPMGPGATVLKALHAYGEGIAVELERPQDIEWVVVGDAVRIVQARPITALLHQPSVNLAQLRATVTRVNAANVSQLPDELAAKDKFRLRTVASSAGVAISAGWLISMGGDRDGAVAIADAAAIIGRGVERSDQVSIVLQRPARLDGEIVRKFSPVAELAANLCAVAARVGRSQPEFDLIVTEIYRAEKSGIAHMANGRLMVEVAFGSYVPKGVVATSLYVVLDDGSVETEALVEQESAVFIEDGKPIERRVHARASLDASQLQAVRKLTAAVSDAYPDVSVEFGVLADGTPYLIDIIPEMSPIPTADIRVMSGGSVTGSAVLVDSEELLARSLDAHFHSSRADHGQSDRAVVVVAPRPFLALEDYLGRHRPGTLGFVFEQGSLLGHLAILLREHGVPAVIVPGIQGTVSDGDSLTVDTTTDALVTIAAADTRA